MWIEHFCPWQMGRVVVLLEVLERNQHYPGLRKRRKLALSKRKEAKESRRVKKGP